MFLALILKLKYVSFRERTVRGKAQLYIYEIFGKFHCKLTVFGQKQNLTNGLDSTPQNIDHEHLRKMATIFNSCQPEN